MLLLSTAACQGHSVGQSDAGFLRRQIAEVKATYARKPMNDWAPPSRPNENGYVWRFTSVHDRGYRSRAISPLNLASCRFPQRACTPPHLGMTWFEHFRGADFDVKFRHRSNAPMRVRTELILPKSMQPPARASLAKCPKSASRTRAGDWRNLRRSIPRMALRFSVSRYWKLTYTRKASLA